MTTVNYVDAKFGGEQVRFSLKGTKLRFFEEANGSASALLDRLVNRRWLAKDVECVLTWSHPQGFGGLNKVVATLSRAPGIYAALAATVLVASLTGIDAESAVFDDEETE